MITLRTIAEMRGYPRRGSVGLVPTMGAFHAGHHSLIRAARDTHDDVVVSLFVNPAQFNDTHDLAALQKHRAAITDTPAPLVAVSRNGVNCSGLQAAYGPEQLLAAWRKA